MPRVTPAARWTAGLVLVGLAATAQAQSLRFLGSANGLPFPPSCSTASMQITLPTSTNGITASITCNGVNFSCALNTLPTTTNVSTVSLRDSATGVSTIAVQCAPNATITNLQTAITRFYQSIADFNADSSIAGPTCFLVGDRVVSPTPSPVFTADREYRYTCVNNPGGGSPTPVACYVVDRWSQGAPQSEPRYLRWNAQGTAILVDDCINSQGPGGPLNSPYIFEDGAEEETTREAQSINFPQPPAQTFSPSGTFTISATATSGLAVSFVSETAGRCTVSGNTVTIVSAGTGTNGCRIRAEQNGNSQWQPATPVTRTIDINRAPQTIVFEPPAAVPVTAQTFSWPSPTGGGSGNPVVVVSLTPDVCLVSTTAGHTADIVATGDCVLQASQAGNANYNPATVMREVQITPPN